ncbi:MAG: polysaccharide deacetylase family protein, partial [Acidobacteriota bacterium]
AESLRLLKPGGVLLCTVAALGRISYEDRGLDGDYWRFTEASLRALFAEAFPLDSFAVTGFGNVLACAAFSYGLALHELTPAELDAHDPYFPLIYGVRAVKEEAGVRGPGSGVWPPTHPGEEARVRGPGTGDRAPTRPGNRGPGTGDRGGVPVQPGGAAPKGNASRAGDCSGSPGSVLTQRLNSQEERGRGSAVILAYHRVGEADLDPHGLCVSPPEFRAHMEAVRNGFAPISLPALIAAVTAGALPERAVAVTLDDGYADNLVAAEILADLGIPATFFVTGLGLDGAHEFWWDALARVMLGPAKRPGELEIEIAGERVWLATVDRAQRTSAHGILWDRIFPLSWAEQEHVVEQLGRWAGGEGAPADGARPMNRAELLRLAGRPGHTIGAHTTHHLKLDAQPEEVRRREVAGHKAFLEQVLGRPVTVFSYPYGVVDAATAELVREAVLAGAVIAGPGVVRPDTDPYLLPRSELRGCEIANLVNRIEGLLAL